MGLPAEKLDKMSAEEYLLWEEKQPERYDFHQGEVFMMAGGTLNHNTICLNLAFALKKHFGPKGCRVFSENVRLQAKEQDMYTYPDALLTCHPQDVKAVRMISHPSLIIEVFSDSSIDYDLGTKWRYYQKISDLRYYLLIAQDKAEVMLYSRSENVPSQWLYQLLDDKTLLVSLPDLELELPFEVIYEGVSW